MFTSNPLARVLRSSVLLAVLMGSQFTRADTFEIAGTSWANSGTEYPSMCITFGVNGELKFKGGFAYYNPARWKKAEGFDEIEITLGGRSQFPEDALAYQQAHRPRSGLLGFNAKKRLIKYQIGIAQPIDFVGFLFYLQKDCGDA